MRRLGWLIVLLPLVAACGAKSAGRVVTAGGAARGSCVQPYLNDRPPGGPFHPPAPTVRAGDTLTVYGHWYTRTCNDTSGAHDPRRPLPPVHLTVTLPGGHVEHLGPYMPGGRDLGFIAKVHIPAGTLAGTASISDNLPPFPGTYRFIVGHA